MTGFGGTTQRMDIEDSAVLKPSQSGRVIKVFWLLLILNPNLSITPQFSTTVPFLIYRFHYQVDFTSTVHSTMPWTFTPTQRAVAVVPGETALAFYTVKNNADVAITGIYMSALNFFLLQMIRGLKMPLISFWLSWCSLILSSITKGVATYNVYPPKAGLYFNKIQCFCFEEQRLGPKEEIDMPVFFVLDPELVHRIREIFFFRSFFMCVYRLD